MKKILKTLEKSEFVEYYRTSGTKFSVGNFVGIKDEFGVFNSITPFGKNEGYKFIKIDELKILAKNTDYLEMIREKIEERNFNSKKSIVLGKEKFFSELFKYFIKNKVKLRINWDNDNVDDVYLIKKTKDMIQISMKSE